MIVSNFYIFKTIVHALIDPGSTHSYICTTIPSLSSLPKSKTEYDILVTNPLGHNVIVNSVYRDFPIRIREYEFLGVTPQTRGSVDYPSTRGIQVEVGLPDATFRKSGRVSFVRGALPKYITCINLSQSTIT